MNIEHKLLFGASVLMLSMGSLSALSNAQCTTTVTGNQTLSSVSCVNSAGNPVDPSYCTNHLGPQPNPATSQSCSETVSIPCGQNEGGEGNGSYGDSNGNGRQDDGEDGSSDGARNTI